MNIIAHRGLWDTRKDQNSMSAFKRALDLGFGVELDVRDSFGHLVVSHDPTEDSGNLQFDEVIELFSQYESIMAINIKSDGLIPGLNLALRNTSKERYFVFDMSIPETIGYLNTGFPTFIRVSEFEELSPLHVNSSGIWLDAFESEWWTGQSQVFQDFKAICVVSPELHGRDEDSGWNFLRSFTPHNNLSLCTDYPVKASEYFK
jgi:hypothetical protein